MGFTIAVAGKGGTGKTTISGFLIKYLYEKFNTPILAIDADPNMNLNEVIGVEIDQTIGSIRESIRSENEKIPEGISKIEYLDLKINQALIESSKVDLLVMGRPEGTGCYCAANHLIRRAIDQLNNKYKFIVIDNEAGMEHLSRQTTQNIDLMLIVSDSSWRGITAGLRIKELVKELNLNIKSMYLIINRAGESFNSEYLPEIEKAGLRLLGILPEDKNVTEYDFKKIPLINLPKDSKIINELTKLFDSLQLKL